MLLGDEHVGKSSLFRQFKVCRPHLRVEDDYISFCGAGHRVVVGGNNVWITINSA